jgi:molybdenum cofactor synthesis domain
MLELEDAVARILSSLPQARTETIDLAHAHGRIVAANISAPINLPPFDNSSMDGYAVRASDLARASELTPAVLRLAGRIVAGQAPDVEVQPGRCVRVFTGSVIPPGADAVVMQEDTAIDPSNPNQIQFLETVKPWENIRFHGEDVKAGTTILQSGQEINAARLSILAATGISQISVAKRPTVTLLATGSELQQGGGTLSPGQIFESNRASLRPLIERAGGCLVRSEIVPDDPASTRRALETAFATSDMVITCGGVSVGEMDFVKGAFEQLGGKLEFWKVAIKPGRPFVFGQLESKFLFGLPGNPVSAFVTFLLLTRPALLGWQGAASVKLPRVRGTMAETISNPGNRRHFVRVTIDDSGTIHSAGIQASHTLSSLANANGLLDMAPKTELQKGAEATVMRWG